MSEFKVRVEEFEKAMNKRGLAIVVSIAAPCPEGIAQRTICTAPRPVIVLANQVDQISRNMRVNPIEQAKAMVEVVAHFNGCREGGDG